MIRRIFGAFVCTAVIVPVSAEVLQEKQYIVDSDINAISEEQYKITLPDGLKPEVRSALLDKVYELMDIDPSNVKGDPKSKYTTLIDSTQVDKYLKKFKLEPLDVVKDCSTATTLTNMPNLIVVKIENTEQSGMAHGTYSQSYVNWNPVQNREIAINEYITTQSQLDALKKYLYKQAKKRLGNDLQLTEDKFYVSTNFYLSDKAITFVYDVYEIGPWSAGDTQITVPFKTLKNMGKKSRKKKGTSR